MRYRSVSYQRGDTIKLILAAIIVIFVITMVFASTLSNCSGRTRSIAQAEADEYLKRTGLAERQDAKAVCVSIDSDGDGYVSCPYATKTGITVPLECAGAFTLNTGCRPPKMVVTQPLQRPKGLQ